MILTITNLHTPAKPFYGGLYSIEGNNFYLFCRNPEHYAAGTETPYIPNPVLTFNYNTYGFRHLYKKDQRMVACPYCSNSIFEMDRVMALITIYDLDRFQDMGPYLKKWGYLDVDRYFNLYEPNLRSEFCTIKKIPETDTINFLKRSILEGRRGFVNRNIIKKTILLTGSGENESIEHNYQTFLADQMQLEIIQ